MCCLGISWRKLRVLFRRVHGLAGNQGPLEQFRSPERPAMSQKTPRRSRYDALHDKYHQILTTKAGTRYERLAALVFKVLEDKNVVVHDLKLAGEDTDVKHQIDVSIESASVTKRATCHGTDGKGNGPISPLLNVAPPDLTVLAKKTAYFPLALFIKSLTGDKRSRPMALATCRFGATRTPWARLGSRFHTIPKCSCAVAF